MVLEIGTFVLFPSAFNKGDLLPSWHAKFWKYLLSVPRALQYSGDPGNMWGTF